VVEGIHNTVCWPHNGRYDEIFVITSTTGSIPVLTTNNLKRDKMENIIEKCRCGSDSESLHICPYQQDINGDSETLCNCCSDCEHQCMMDI
jgi:hypothetical protein